MPFFMTRRKLRPLPAGAGGGGVAAPTGLVATAGTGQITLTHDAVAGATRYGTYRNTVNNPDTATLINDSRTGTTYTDTTVTGTSPWYYWVDTVIVEGGTTTRSLKSSMAQASLPSSGGASAMAPGAITAYPGYESFGIEVPYTGDDWNASAAATVRTSTDGGATWAAARPLKRLHRNVVGTATAGTLNSITLATTAGTNKDYYVGWKIRLTGGTGAGQIRDITAYPGTGRVATVSPDWTTIPDATSVYRVESPERLLAGNFLNATPGSTVRVELTYSATDGVNGTAIVTHDVPLKTDSNIAGTAFVPFASLVATHFVRSDGSNSNSGTANTAAGAWLTVAHAVAQWVASGGHMVLQLQQATRFAALDISVPSGVNGTLTIKGAVAACDANGNEINAGQHSYLQGGVVTGPTGGLAPIQNAWTQRTFTLPGGGTHAAWVYTVPGLPVGGQADFVGYAATYDETPWCLAKAKLNTGATATDDAACVEWVLDNDWYKYWWFPSRTNANEIIIPQLPPAAPNTNPNSLYMTIGYGSAFIAQANGTPRNGSTFRLSGVHLRGYYPSVISQGPGVYHRFDGCLFDGNRWGINFNKAAGTSTLPSADPVVEGCQFKMRGLRAAPGVAVDTRIIPWRAVKGKPTANVGGVVITQSRAGEFNEGASIRGSSAIRLTVRNCVSDGVFNGVGGGGEGRLSFASTEVYDCRFLNVADDCVAEHEPDSFLLRVFDNRAEYCSTWATSADGRWGPKTYARNVVWRWGYQEIAAALHEPLDKGVGPLCHKVSGRHIPDTMTELINETYWSDQPDTRVIHKTNSGNPGDQPDWFIRNCIMRSGWTVVHSGDADGWNENYSFLAAPDGTRVTENYKTTIASYRTATLAAFGATSGANSNVTPTVAEFNINAVAALDALLTSPTTGVLTLAAATGGGKAEGIAVPNYAPGTPNIGAL